MKNALFIFLVFSTVRLLIPAHLNAQVIVIDPGHGVQANCTNCNRPDEEVLTVMSVSNLLKDTLEANCSWTVHLTRTSNDCNQCPTLSQRETMSNSWGADRFLSIHGNAGGGTGTETFWCEQSAANDVASAAFSDEVQARMVQFGQWTDRRSEEDAGYLGFHLGVLNNNNAIGCLSEIAFYDNASDWLKMNDLAWQAQFAHAYFVALQNDMNVFCSGGNPPTPPENDDCANATVLQINVSCVPISGTLENATASGVAKPSCDAFGSPALLDVWYAFEATASTHVIEQTANPNFDGVIALYSACGNTELFCSDNQEIGIDETITATGLTIGNTYYIRVYDYGTIAPTDPTFEICVTGQPVVTEPDLEITSAGANPNSVEPGETTDLTYTIINSGAGAVNTQSQTGYYLVPISQGCPTSIPGGLPFFQGQLAVSEMADNTETEVHTVTISAATTPGDYYVVIVTDWENAVAEEDETNNIFCTPITVTAPVVPPPNDDCSNAISLTPNTLCVNTAGTLENATASGVAKPSCDVFGSPALLDVWYSFVAINTQHNILQTANPNFDGVIALYSACGGSELFCSDNQEIGIDETITATGLTIGNTYYIRVYDYGTIAPTDPTFNICVTTPIITAAESVTGEASEFSIYPNPTNGVFTVEMDLKVTTDVELIVFSSTGQRVFQQQLYQQKGKFNHRVELRNVASGTYYVQLSVGSKVITRSVSVMDE